MTQKVRYILRIEDGELFPFYVEWLKIPGMVEYDPAKHGYRSEVAEAMGLTAPAPVAQPQTVALTKTPIAEHVAGETVTLQPAVVEPEVAQPAASEPDLSDVFAKT